MNAFKTILITKGYTQGITGAWLSPDAKYTDNSTVVTFQAEHPDRAYVHQGKFTFPYNDSQVDLENFRKAV